MIGETVTRLRAPTAEDRYGNLTPNWGAAVEVDFEGCAVAPLHEDEDTANGRQGRIIGFTIYRPGGGMGIAATDRLRVRGEIHEVNSNGQTWVSPWSTVTAGDEIQTKRVEG